MSKTSLLIATQNLGKYGEFREMLSGSFACVQPDRAVHVVEDGSTYFENALKKAIGFYQEFKQPVLSDDSGLEVDALDGDPGIYSARFGGEDLTWPDRWEALYTKIRSRSSDLRSKAQFVCVLCYFDGQNVPKFFQGMSKGEISPEPKGSKGFGYDPVFYSNLLGKTFAEASSEEKDKASHRAEAIRNFLVWWKSTHPSS